MPYKDPEKQKRAQYEWYLRNKELTHERNLRYKHSIKGKYSSYKTWARIRKIPFELTKNDFKKLWNKPCTYCGKEIKTIGIDRIDNQAPYNKDNCVSCCFRCNSLKGERQLSWFINKYPFVINHNK